VSPFPEEAREALRDAQLRRNLGAATRTIRAKRAVVVEEVGDWEALREAGRALKAKVARHLDVWLERLETSVVAAGGRVHWARDGAEANAVVGDLVAAHAVREVVKVKSLTTDEIGLNEALAERGVEAVETDLAELIVQLSDDVPSHILVPAIHRNRAEIRELFLRTLEVDALGDDPEELAEVARQHLRRRFLRARVGLSGANFGIAETGTVCVVESEGNGRMCTTLPPVLITVMGIEKVLPAWRDLEIFLQLLPRSSTGERMNPYTSLWSGVSEGDGPSEFHLVLLDNGRTRVLADEVGRDALHCIRCSACLNVCPVYSRVGGHAYESVYPGPIGAVLTPQLHGIPGDADSLPWASSLCGACYEACPVKIDIPRLLVHLRTRVVAARRAGRGAPAAEDVAMRLLGWTMAGARRFAAAQRAGALAARPLERDEAIHRAPGLGAWTEGRDLPAPPSETFTQWWRRTRGGASAGRQSGGSGAGERADRDAPSSPQSGGGARGRSDGDAPSSPQSEGGARRRPDG
jgi:L-lactate dehydrogenase complex protein LldF